MSRSFSFSRIVLICIALLLLATTLVSRASAAATEVVVTDQSSDWAFLEEIANGSGSFVVGPATPPVGIGSAQLEVDATGREILVSAFQAGTPLADFTSLSYSAYRSSGDATSTPSLQINVDYDNTDLDFSWQGRLVYEPYMNGSLPDDTWTDWDTLSGNWWASGAPGNTQCPQNSPCTWAEVLTHFPNASVHGTLGAILFKVGGPWAAGFVGNVDNLLVGVSGAETLYNFEPARCINTTASTGHGTIQDAVDNASAGDTIECEAGTYEEHVVIDKNDLTLTGSGAGTDPSLHTILDGTNIGAGSGIHLNSGVTGVTIENLRVQNYSLSNSSQAGISAAGQNNDFTLQNVHAFNITGGRGGVYMNGPVDNVLIDNVTAHYNQGRGIVIWNGFKTNITITNNDVQYNNCCGIELQDGTSSGVTFTGNTIANNSDSGMAVLGMKAGAGANLIANNNILNNGRFGMEIKNPDGTGATSGDGSIVVEDNYVSFTASPSMNNRDHGGIVVIRRDFLPGNTTGYPDVPTGVVVRDNDVIGYTHQNQVGAPTESEGFGIVIEGTNHTVTGNVLNNNMVAIQEQGGNHPNGNYVPDDAGSGSQNAGDSDSYFGRGNAPVACGNTIGPNTFNGNTINFRQNVASGSGSVTNTDTGEIFCSIQSAIDDSDTQDGHTLQLEAETYAEEVTVSKSINLVGAGVASTTLTPTVDTGTSGDARAWYLVDGNKEFHLSDLTMDATGYKVYQAIRQKGSGSVDNVAFKEIQYNASGPHYQGVAIAAFGTGPVHVTNSTFEDIGRIGVLYYGGNQANAMFDNNTYTGKGIGDWLDYALDISAGATVSVTNNVISGNRGVASSDGSNSACILVSTYFAGGTEAVIENNDLSDCTIAIAQGYDANDMSVTTVKGNEIDNVDTAFEQTGSTATFTAYANNITNFTQGVNINGSPNFNAGHNWWGAFSPQQPGVDNDSWEWRLGAAVEDWADGTGSASLNDSVEGTASLTGSGMTVIVSHGRASTPAEAPFGKAISAEIGPNQCSDFYDMFVVGASSGSYDVVLPVATGTCQTIANAAPAIEQFALTGSGAPDADGCSPDEACWNDVSASYSAGTLTATVPASAVKGTPFTTPSSNGNDPTAIGLQGLGATGSQQPLVAISAVVALLALFSIGLLLNKRQRAL